MVGADLELAVANLEATYRTVGLQFPGSAEEGFEGGFACLSALPHAVSNFAIVGDEPRAAAKKLADWARRRTAFNVYVVPGAHQEAAVAQLFRVGFREAGQLRMMSAAIPDLVANAAGQAPLFEVRKRGEDDIVEARTFELRLSIGRFMSVQFFGRQTSALRESIALSTARASSRLFTFGPKKPIGAAMAVRSGTSFGIYNLCVEATMRERGYGSALLEQLLGAAAVERLTPTLQCDPALEPWYAKRGFAPQGTIVVMGLDRKPYHAIM